ncbi:hypothetical protein [Bremerella cremea]|uniref:hypothetical protein n=1 Tax=Bremerella cremea TaxID=1031537 RepID=UPI0031E8EFE5
MKRSLSLFSLALIALLGVGSLLISSPKVQAADPSLKADGPVPVEPDMHEFMEYVFQPTFKRLKPAMAEAPADNAGWKVLKEGSLKLAEGGNLLLARVPKEDSADWIKHSIGVRDFGGKFYRASQAKDFATAKKNYESMVQSCNACHHQFAHGEHILTP